MPKKVEEIKENEDFAYAKNLEDTEHVDLLKRRATNFMMGSEAEGVITKEKLLKDLKMQQFLEKEAAFKIFNKFAQVKQLDGIWALYSNIPKFQETFQTMSSTEKKDMIDSITSNFKDKKVNECLSVKLIDSVNTCSASGNYTADMFTEIKKLIDHQMEKIYLKSFKESKYAEEYIAATLSLDDVSRDHHCLIYFEKFLASEYSQENINFYDRVNKYKKNWNPDNTDLNYDKAMYVLNLYVSQEAPCQINIPAKMRLKIERKILREKDASKNVFDNARTEIFNLMKKDAWPRFRKSKYWSEYLNSTSQTDTILSPADVRRHDFLEYLGIDSMETVVTSKVGRDFFGKYLKVLYSNDGSMDFYVEVKQFEANKEQGEMELVLNAQAIYAKFLAQDAAFPVKVDEKYVKKLSEKLEGEKVDHSMFNPAIKGMIRSLVENNCFTRFRYTGLYTSYRLLASNGK